MKMLSLIAAAAAALLAPAVAVPAVAAPVAAEAQVDRTTVVRNRNGTVVRRTTTTRRYNNRNRSYNRGRNYRGYRTVCTTRYRGGERRRVCRRVRR